MGMTDNQQGAAGSRNGEPSEGAVLADSVFLTTAAGAIGTVYVETRVIAVALATAAVAVAVAWRRGLGR